MRAGVLFLFCSFAIYLLVNAAEADVDFKTKTATVFYVEDGDTFYLRFPNDPIEYVANLIGVDAAGWKEEGGSCYAREAGDFLRSLILNKEVTIKWDSIDKIDRRGRFLVYVEVGGKDINAEVIRGGYGWVPRRFHADRKDDYIQLEKISREAKKGLWGACPEDYLRDRPSHRSLPPARDWVGGRDNVKGLTA